MPKENFWKQPWGWKQRLVYALESLRRKHVWIREADTEVDLVLKETPTAQYAAPFAVFKCAVCGEHRMLELVIGAPSGGVYQRKWRLK